MASSRDKKLFEEEHAKWKVLAKFHVDIIPHPYLPITVTVAGNWRHENVTLFLFQSLPKIRFPEIEVKLKISSILRKCPSPRISKHFNNHFTAVDFITVVFYYLFVNLLPTQGVSSIRAGKVSESHLYFQYLAQRLAHYRH